ncbi:hypothetical protein EMIHUDRAFT_432887 [Emiliania huxleyi CCMP1516]|uniref:UBA domain-containing protein n=2 Tax=Emiliania huxleyi TaxID=2903 RepID=A0A0D3IE18_EMIH1|nr:hypothetical protein EMIHUDRAFT_432887 [Emiliania huxleyi CCMP1516]EOD09503.1 hypothetical protein EMIHUDRAFT_432887 [Emiliania huxleyi CCMP1516]|eukprot:XP_005761932.1 hypothetical protein EMIHUDRAFT_432887 [Emiliania huxleyi CCMP1516]
MDSHSLSALTDLGFTDEQAAVALQMSSGNVQRAVNFLLENAQATEQVGAPPARPPPSATTERAEGDRALQEALAASRREAAGESKRRAEARQAELAAASANTACRGGRAASAAAAAAERRAQTASSASGGRGGCAASAAAAAAAQTASSASSETSGSRPSGGGGAAAAAAAIARFAAPQASTAEQRVQACASRLAGSARCVDALIASLERAIANPEDERCRKVSLTNKAFRERVGSVPGGVDFLYAVGFEPMHGHLVLQRRDTALLWVGKAALQAAQESLAYRGSKEALQLREALQLSSSEYAAEEAARRQAWLQKVPDEPPEGQAGSALICVHVGEAQHWRRFDSSEVLEDVVNFARSLPGVPLGRPIGLSNVTLRPAVRLDLATECGLTLQRLDLWPTGHLRVEAG